jgi:hypothetical protein
MSFGGIYFSFLDAHTQSLCEQWFRRITHDEVESIYLLAHSSTHSLILYTHLLTYLLTYLLTHSLTHSLPQTPANSTISPVIYSKPSRPLHLDITRSLHDNFLALPNTIVLGE